MDNSNLKVCTECGTQYPVNYSNNVCVICEDERQAVPQSGQSWTTHEKLLEKHSVKIKKLSNNLYEFMVNPGFSIVSVPFLYFQKMGIYYGIVFLYWMKK